MRFRRFPLFGLNSDLPPSKTAFVAQKPRLTARNGLLAAKICPFAIKNALLAAMPARRVEVACLHKVFFYE